MAEVEVRLFQPHEWKQYRELRLRALEESPDAFGGTLAQARLQPDSVWVDRLSNICTDFDLPLLVQVDGEACGLAWGKIQPAAPETAHLYQMWVAPQQRGFGAGMRLLERVISWAREREARELLLSVTCGDSPARRMYERTGFAAAGELEPLRPGSDMLVQPMRLDLGGGGS